MNPVTDLREALRRSVRAICITLQEVQKERSPHEVFLTALLGCLDEIDTR